MLIPDHASSHGLGLLDFQDALVGHPAYDLVSLLQDARRDVPPDIEAEMIAHYKAVARPNGNFDAVYAILDAQRRSDERRVGKEGVSTCRSRWSQDHKKQTNTYRKNK